MHLVLLHVILDEALRSRRRRVEQTETLASDTPKRGVQMGVLGHG